MELTDDFFFVFFKRDSGGGNVLLLLLLLLLPLLSSWQDALFSFLIRSSTFFSFFGPVWRFYVGVALGLWCPPFDGWGAREQGWDGMGWGTSSAGQ